MTKLILAFIFCFIRELNPHPSHVERGNIADKLQPRNINVSFNNNSNVAVDVIIFTFYSDQLTIDVETGIVTK